MSDSPKQFKLTHELRILIASLLSVGVILLWVRFFAPKPPVAPPQGNKPAQTAPAPSAPAPTPSAPAGNAGQRAQATGISAPPKANIPTRADTQERSIVVENDLYRVEFSNRGAVVKSWQLKKYFDDAKPPRVLDVVHQDAAQQTGGWPFALVLDDEELEKQANSGLFLATQPEGSGAQPLKTPSKEPAALPAGTLKAPIDLQFVWSDGRIEVTKRFRFDHTYVVRAETSVKVNGTPTVAGLAWLGGFGDLTVSNPAPIETVSIFYSQNGKLNNISAKKLDGPDKWPRGFWQGGKDWAGIEDRYFAAAFLPPNEPAPGSLETRQWRVSRTVKVDDKDTEEPVPQVATAAPAAQPLTLRVYVGPKDYDELKRMNPPLNALVQFGWFEFIADPLFHALKWLHKYISNWGWAIVVLTLILNMVLFPLRLSSYKTTLKMQRVAPEVKQIQEKYKKYSMRDPRKAEMNKEVMALYAREGINPVGGCIPQFLQFPIWLGLYRALQGTIELRHAPWFWWIRDLSAKDPYYILPVLMGLSMYLSTKMTPMTTADPQQQAMMKFMPIAMSAIFFVVPYPSGLAVYILTSGVVGMVQQWYLMRTHPLPAQAKPVRGKKGKKQ